VRRMRRMPSNVVALPARPNSNVVAMGPGLVLNLRPSIHEELAAVTVRAFELEVAMCKAASEFGMAVRLKEKLTEQLSKSSSA
jgi:hypothetical protein